MKRKSRKFVFFLLVTTFALAAPVVLLFASGYRYNWHKHKIEKTGIVFVGTDPEGASVTVDGKPAKETTPVSIPNLLPEEYRVTAEKSGYLPWSKNLRVESGRTTFAKGVILLRDEVPYLLKGADISVSAFSDDGTAVAYLAADDEWSELSLYDARTRDTLLLARYAKDKYEDVSIKMSADGSFLLFEGKVAGKSRRDIIVYPATVSGRGVNVAPDLGGTSGLSAVWSMNGSSMVAVGGTGAFSVDTAQGTINPLPAGRSVRDAFYAADYVWLIREGEETDLLERVRPDGGSSAESYIALPRKGYDFVGGNGRYLIMTDGRAGGGLSVDTYSGGLRELPHATGLEWEFPDRTGRLLLWNDFEIFVLNPESPTTALITRIGTGIGNCAWHPESKYVIYSDRDGITAIEMDSRDRRNIYRLVRFDSVGSMAMDREAGVLRFTGSIGNQKGIFERPL